MKQKKELRLWAILLWLLVWEAASLAINRKLFLVSPVTVVVRLSELISDSLFWTAVLHSFLRIVGGYLAGIAAGAFLAGLSGRFVRIRELLAPLMLTVKSVPVASFIILTLLFLPSRLLAVFISFLMVLPMIYGNVLEGIGSMDRNLLEMAKLFGIPKFRVLRYLYLPHVISYFSAGAATAIGFAWKSGIAAEVIGMPRGSIGERLQQAKVYLDTPDLLAWTVVIVVLCQLSGKGFGLLLARAQRLLAGENADRLSADAEEKSGLEKAEREASVDAADESGPEAAEREAFAGSAEKSGPEAAESEVFAGSADESVPEAAEK